MGCRSNWTRVVTVAALASALSLPASARAQAVIKGTLYDDANGAPVPGGAVMLVDPSSDGPVVNTHTDSLGGFELSTGRSGTYQIAALHEGYTSMLSAPLSLVSGERMVIRVPIAANGEPQHNISVLSHVRPNVVPLTPEVRAARAVKEHNAAGLGLTFDRARLAASSARNLGDFLRTVPGIMAANGAALDATDIRMNRTPDMSLFGAATASVGACHVGWFIDGQRVDHRGPTTGTDPIVDGLTATPLDQLQSVEVFRGVSEMPTELYESDLRCGAISLWTRQ